jgi:hypothetical protein
MRMHGCQTYCCNFIILSLLNMDQEPSGRYKKRKKEIFSRQRCRVPPVYIVAPAALLPSSSISQQVLDFTEIKIATVRVPTPWQANISLCEPSTFGSISRAGLPSKHKMHVHGTPGDRGPQIGLSSFVKCRDPRIFQYYFIRSCLHEWLIKHDLCNRLLLNPEN